jgi:hypothetical protein
MVIATLVLTSIGAYGYTRRLWPPHKDENWRDAMAAARKASGTSRLTLLYKCPFIECTERQVRLPESVSNWVTAPLSLYPAPGRVVPIAISFDDSGSSYLEATAVPDLEREGRFIVVTGNPDEHFSTWLHRIFPSYTPQELGSFGTVSATLYVRQDPGSP